MAIHQPLLMSYEATASEAELGALFAALDAAAEPAPNEREQAKEPFLVALRRYPRRVPALAVLPRDGTVPDLVWVFWPDRAPTRHDRGEAFDAVRAVIRLQAEGDALVADIARHIEQLEAA